jgi:hypothetical protein
MTRPGGEGFSGPMLWLLAGVFVGSCLFGNTSAVSLLRLFVVDRGRADQINVPNASPGMLQGAVLMITYPGGASISVLQPGLGGQVKQLNARFRSERSSIAVSCGGGRTSVFFGAAVDAGPDARTISMKIRDGRGQGITFDAKVLPPYTLPNGSSPASGRRTIDVEGDAARQMLSALAEAQFPEQRNLSIADDAHSEYKPLDRISTFGKVQPVASSTFTKGPIPEPPSNPFQVMQSFCAKVA